MQSLNIFCLFVILAFGAAFPQFPNQFGNNGFGSQPQNQFGDFGQNQNQFGAGGQQQFPNQFGAGGQQQIPNQFGQQQFPNQFGGSGQNSNQFGAGGQQQSPNQFGAPQQQVPIPTTTRAPQATTPGPEHYRCIDQCPTLSQYSPLCGSDGMAYHNEQKLQCTNQCGRRFNPNWQEIVALRAGSCTPGGRPFVPSPIV